VSATSRQTPTGSLIIIFESCNSRRGYLELTNMSSNKYNDIVFEVIGKIGIIKFNRPKSLNSFGGKLMVETITALRELNEHPDTIFTVLTGEGRFFSAGADVKGRPEQSLTDI
jgi:1,4-dihydroxy-2-naphthoyl-CoA synthase